MRNIVFLSFLAIVLCGADIAVERAFIKSEIVPDSIPQPPSKFMSVNYPSGVSVHLGNELTPTEVKDVPRLSWEHEAADLYTLTILDPDSPSRTDHSTADVRHWLVVNIPGDDVAAGQTIFDFIGSAPSNNTGLHRYTFLVYKQTQFIDYNGPVIGNRDPTDRFNTSIQTFAAENALDGPIAGNFFLAQYDDYSRILLEEIFG